MYLTCFKTIAIYFVLSAYPSLITCVPIG